MAEKNLQRFETDQFLDNFNPGDSNRERRKKIRSTQQQEGSDSEASVRSNGNKKRDKKDKSVLLF